MKNINISLIDPTTAKLICRLITATLPEWFGVPEANLRYAHGVLSRISFAASIDNNYIGLITLEFPYPGNANIYWMAVSKGHQGKSVGKRLLRAAENYCYEHGFSSLTVETLSPKQNIIPYFKSYYFYEKCGFRPLFAMHTYGPDNLMVYMQKNLSLDQFVYIDLTHVISSDVPHWNAGCGYTSTMECNHALPDVKVNFYTQYIQMYAGIGTHIDAPSHCVSGGLGISDIPLQSLVTRCYMIDVSNKVHDRYSISVDDIQEFEDAYDRIKKNSVVLFYTGWSKRWNTPQLYRNDLIFPSVSKHAAEYLLWRDIAGLGIDTLSADCVDSGYPVHQLMLNAGKYLIENVANANQLDNTGNYIMTLPIKILDGTEAPVRLVGLKSKEK